MTTSIISGGLSQLSYCGWGCGGHCPFAPANLVSPLSSSFALVNNLVSPLSSLFAPVNLMSPLIVKLINMLRTKATTKVHMFAQWTTTVPPEELTGPWDQGVLITDGPSGHLRRNATTHNTHKS